MFRRWRHLKCVIKPLQYYCSSCLESCDLRLGEVVAFFLKYSKNPNHREWFGMNFGMKKDHSKIVTISNLVANSQLANIQTFHSLDPAPVHVQNYSVLILRMLFRPKPQFQRVTTKLCPILCAWKPFVRVMKRGANCPYQIAPS